MENRPEDWIEHIDESKYYVEFVDGNAYNWKICIPAPKNSAYQGAQTWWHLVFPKDFPVRAPVVFAIQQHFPHPNLGQEGALRRLCTPALQAQWNGAGVLKVIEAVEDALLHPGWDHNSAGSGLTKENFQAKVDGWKRVA